MEVWNEELSLMIMKGSITDKEMASVKKKQLLIIWFPAVNHLVSNISLHFAHVIFHTVQNWHKQTA